MVLISKHQKIESLLILVDNQWLIKQTSSRNHVLLCVPMKCLFMLSYQNNKDHAPWTMIRTYNFTFTWDYLTWEHSYSLLPENSKLKLTFRKLMSFLSLFCCHTLQKTCKLSACIIIRKWSITLVKHDFRFWHQIYLLVWSS